MGIESGNISDVAMMSSTVMNASSLPHFGRLRNQLGDCACIPATTADSNSSWLQVDLGSLTKVSAVATQGSCSSDQWTKTYVITYSENGEDWKHYRELGTIRVGIHKKNRIVEVESIFFTHTCFYRCFVRSSLVTTIVAV